MLLYPAENRQFLLGNFCSRANIINKTTLKTPSEAAYFVSLQPQSLSEYDWRHPRSKAIWSKFNYCVSGKMLVVRSVNIIVVPSTVFLLLFIPASRPQDVRAYN
jgi:hypothetical protein